MLVYLFGQGSCILAPFIPLRGFLIAFESHETLKWLSLRAGCWAARAQCRECSVCARGCRALCLKPQGHRPHHEQQLLLLRRAHALWRVWAWAPPCGRARSPASSGTSSPTSPCLVC